MTDAIEAYRQMVDSDCHSLVSNLLRAHELAQQNKRDPAGSRFVERAAVSASQVVYHAVIGCMHATTAAEADYWTAKLELVCSQLLGERAKCP